MLPTRDQFIFKNTHELKVKGWKKIFHENGKKRAWVAILILGKIDFKSKTVTKDKVII